jgi:hypothetical protein
MVKQRADDRERGRSNLSIRRLQRWQETKNDEIPHGGRVRCSRNVNSDSQVKVLKPTVYRVLTALDAQRLHIRGIALVALVAPRLSAQQARFCSARIPIPSPRRPRRPDGIVLAEAPDELAL